MWKCARVIRRRGRNSWESAWCIVECPSSREDSGERERRAAEHELQWSDNRMGGALSGEAQGAGTGPDAVSSPPGPLSILERGNEGGERGGWYERGVAQAARD